MVQVQVASDSEENAREKYNYHNFIGLSQLQLGSSICISRVPPIQVDPLHQLMGRSSSSVVDTSQFPIGTLLYLRTPPPQKKIGRGGGIIFLGRVHY